MIFSVTLTNQEQKRIEADVVNYTDAPGFVMFAKDGEAVITFNASKVESVKTLPEIAK